MDVKKEIEVEVEVEMEWNIMECNEMEWNQMLLWPYRCFYF